MKTFLNLFLVLSLLLNLYLFGVMLLPGGDPPEEAEGAKIEPLITTPHSLLPPERTQSGEDPDPEEYFASRAEALAELGLSADMVQAALQPSINQHYVEDLLANSRTKEESIRSLQRILTAHEDLIESLFGERASRGESNPLNRLRLKVEFDFTTEHEVAIRDVIHKVSGVSLTDDQKERLFEIWNDPDQEIADKSADIQELFGAEDGERILLCLETDFPKYYQMSYALNMEGEERERAALNLYEISRLRSEAMAEWEESDLSGPERAAGTRTVDKQIKQMLVDEIGPEALDLIESNGW